MQQRCGAALPALFAAVFGSYAAVHYHRLGLTLAHYDARAHLVVSRRIFDSLYPGWQQVGAVWLPLPHLLNALPVQIDWLYRTGYSAVAISIASIALAAWAIASVIYRATGSAIGGLVATALLVLNPNVLYLQSTPMTEPLLFGTTFLAVALVAQWTSAFDLRPATAVLRPPTIVPGWALVAATLTRFEAWPIVVALIVLSFVVLTRRGLPAMDALRRVRGLALWPMWALIGFLINSKITVGSWFVSSGFFVPDNPARGHAWMAWTEVWDGVARLTGPVVPWAGVAATIAIVASVATPNTQRTDSSAANGRHELVLVLVLALAACAILPWGAYYQGHPVRIRYAVPLAAAAAAVIGAAVAVVPRTIAVITGAAVVGVALWQAPPLDRNAPVIVEAQRVKADDAARTRVTAYLATHWDGRPIMMSMGSLAQYMHDLSASGFNLRDFLHEGNGELWTFAMRTPRPYVEWIAMQEKEDRDEIYRQTRIDPRFLAGYARVSSGGGVALYRRCTIADCRAASAE